MDMDRVVVFLRHGEKHDWDKGHPPSAFHIESFVDHHELSCKGWERAHALVGYFDRRPEVKRAEYPVRVLIAQSVDTDPKKPVGRSHRPVQTLEPLSRHLDVPITAYTRKEGKRLVDDLVGRTDWANKTIIVSWNHKEIPELVKDVMAKYGVTGQEVEKWGKRYDVTWMLEPDGKGVKFSKLSQRLLFGDVE